MSDPASENLRNAARAVYDSFAALNRMGLRSRDRDYAIALLGQALDLPQRVVDEATMRARAREKAD